jgi:hypothetical protein
MLSGLISSCNSAETTSRWWGESLTGVSFGWGENCNFGGGEAHMHPAMISCVEPSMFKALFVLKNRIFAVSEYNTASTIPGFALSQTS